MNKINKNTFILLILILFTSLIFFSIYEGFLNANSNPLNLIIVYLFFPFIYLVQLPFLPQIESRNLTIFVSYTLTLIYYILIYSLFYFKKINLLLKLILIFLISTTILFSLFMIIANFHFNNI